MKKTFLRRESVLHIALITLGAILILIPAFHTNIWFDESYSVGLVNHSFTEIWTIGGNDVHPILYYWMLKIINILFGSNIVEYRIFSAIGIITLGIIGFTHIKKDFGTKTGLLFTFFSLFLPVMLNYALEIRMYSWTIVFVTLMTIYLNRFIYQKSIKNIILFGVFSILSCYMHYYALVCAGIVNLGLIIYVIKNKKIIDKKIIKMFIIVEIVQVILYIPWLFCFIKQLTRVGGGFWITIEIPQILIDIINFQFKGNLNEIIPTIFAVALWSYIIYIIIKNIKSKKDIKEGIIPVILYLLVIVAVSIVSLKSPILYARYLFTITGLIIFAIAYLLAKENNKFIIGFICGIILTMSINNVIINIQENYDNSNSEPIEYLKENLQPEDIIIYSSINNGGVIAASIDTNQQYFLNLENWTIEEAYKAYAPQMKVAYSFEEALNGAQGRIFIIDDADLNCYQELENKEEYETVDIKKFEPKYKNYTYQIMILNQN